MTSKTAPFSAHARGVPLFDKTRFSDVPDHAARLLLHLRDMSSSSFWFFSMQSWTTFWSVLVAIVSVIFYTYFDKKYSLAADMDWSMIGFIVILPLVGFIWMAFQRRERCLELASEAKVLMLHIWNASRLWLGGNRGDLDASVQLTVDTALQTVCRSMHAYFLPARFYSRSYPYFGYKSAMIQIAMDRSRHQREIKLALTQLTAAIVEMRNLGLREVLESQLHDRVYSLQVVIDKMSNVKEFRTPQGIRSMSRMYIALIIPLFFGPYWAYIGRQVGFAFCFFLAALIQIALCGLVNVALDLEDPFDNYGLDGVFIDEQLFEVSQLLPVGTSTISRPPSFAAGLNTMGNALDTTPRRTTKNNEGEENSNDGAGEGGNGESGSVLPSAFAQQNQGEVPRNVRVETDTV